MVGWVRVSFAYLETLEFHALRAGFFGSAYEELSVSSDDLALGLFLVIVPLVYTPLWIGICDRAPCIRKRTRGSES